MIRFRERMVGPVGAVAREPWVLRPRGPAAADGIVRVAGTTVGARDSVLDLADLHVHVTGTDADRDGYRAVVHRGTVHGIGPESLPVVCGFADLLTRSVGGRRMHYRVLVLHRGRPVVVDGVKAVRGGVRTAWTATTTLHTVVVAVDPSAWASGTEAGGWTRRLEVGDVPGEVVAAGVLRVRGLLRQGTSLRGDVLGFLTGFLRRAVVR
ncbi:hypothetical protein LQK89_16335 [Curtobacterium sp. C1]|uniref:hypothetical protein n=1 Tax=Curtobacterium sp. C1 TaxID=2898151 RepID=UPI001E54C19E|nr:hypothetical protein [Curtobacterium sp. C1]UFU14045.1 hypothetical protein LQK89_16335 [Curtobacterium sp. C1]